MENYEPEILRTIPRTTEISWEALEHEHIPVSPDWYWTVALIALSLAGVSAYLDNLLFSLFCLLAGSVIIMFKIKGPQVLTVRLTPRGVIIKNTLYPYGRIESFWIFEKGSGFKEINELSIRSSRAVMPQIIIPLGDTDIELVRDYLVRYIPETYHEKTLADVLTDFLGF